MTTNRSSDTGSGNRRRKTMFICATFGDEAVMISPDLARRISERRSRRGTILPKGP